MRRSAILSSAILAASLSLHGHAQTYPVKPVRMVVPFPSGSASDVLGRIVALRLTEIYSQQIVIDNRPGAGGLIGSELALKAAPDGYTLAMVGQPHLSNVLLREQKPYDPLRDFTAISLVATTPNVIIIGNGVPAKTVPELIALAKAKPGGLNYGSAGVGSSSHLAGAMFVSAAHINVVHVPFRTGPDSRSALIAGTVHFYVYPLPAIMTMLQAGTLKAIAVASRHRAAAIPDVPTTAESGFPQYQSESWFGVIAPAGLPKPVIARLNADIVAVLKEPDIRERFTRQGAEPGFGAPADFHNMQRDEYAQLGKLIKEIGMKLQ
jgi:tripartite-type tricarboxylate transporter receptor subunit TctC